MILQKIKNILDSILIEKGINNSKDYAISFPPEHISLNFHLSTNLLLVLRSEKNYDKNLDSVILNSLKKYDIFENVEIHGNNFINFKLSNNSIREFLTDVSNNGDEKLIEKKENQAPINLEFVSCNPTGPMHIGHVRGAIIGDVLANIMSRIGLSITREFCINDNGNQIKNLLLSVFYHLSQFHGEDVEKSDDFYQGEYVLEVAKKVNDKFSFLDIKKDLNTIKKFVINLMIDDIKTSLSSIKVHHDVFTSVQGLIDNADVSSMLKFLENENLIYKGQLDGPVDYNIEKNDQESIIFKSTSFGDDKDRVIERSNGELTYFGGDFVYHKDKIDRGFNNMILILGSDHKGYQKRMEAIVHSLSKDANIKVILAEMVNFLKNGQPLKMSKRKGNFLIVEDVLSEIDQDLLRFSILSYKRNTVINFDIDKVKEQKKENPAFYVQYACVRCHSVLSDLKISELDHDTDVIFEAEHAPLISRIIQYGNVINKVIKENEPHFLVEYLIKLASDFHSLWNAGTGDKNLKFNNEDKSKKVSNFLLIKSIHNVLKSGLSLLKIRALEKM